ncbi:hypothetical protein SPFL3102_02649 [Sporomusaceae bacterium FL31]|nr:hypothetical protein SPFL3101_02624 [Sporomusaceae bacterium FL31]GCE34822.1 hypothetical protein SPFL3102_02649 [Sporomusaceae bacterium]
MSKRCKKECVTLILHKGKIDMTLVISKEVYDVLVRENLLGGSDYFEHI